MQKLIKGGGGGGGGGGVFRTIILEILILRYELKGKGQDTSRNFKGGFGYMRTILPMRGLGAKMTELC